MNRQEKEAVIASLKENFAQSSATFVVGIDGVTVNQFESVRKNLRQEGGKLQVAKVRLMKILFFLRILRLLMWLEKI